MRGLLSRCDHGLHMQGTMSARFLRHEGFLGAVGAFLKVHPMTPPNQPASVGREPRKVSLCGLYPKPPHCNGSPSLREAPTTLRSILARMRQCSLAPM